MEGTIIFRASPAVKDRIEQLVEKEKTVGLSHEEKKELDGFEEIDDYLSHVNRLVRNSNVLETFPLPPKSCRSLKEQIRRRADFLCEYCHTFERWKFIEFTIDHVIPSSLGGTDDFENLALARVHCNRRKSNRISIFVDPAGDEIKLFNPRTTNWKDHFVWSNDRPRIIPLTEIGSVTVQLFELNRPRVVQLRYDDILVDRHPPIDDPVQQDQFELRSF